MPWVKVDQSGLLAEMRQEPCSVCGASGFDPCKGSMRKKPYIVDGMAYQHARRVVQAPKRRGKPQALGGLPYFKPKNRR